MQYCNWLKLEYEAADRDGQALDTSGLATRQLLDAQPMDQRLVRRLEMVKLVRRLAYEDFARRVQRRLFARVNVCAVHVRYKYVCTASLGGKS